VPVASLTYTFVPLPLLEVDVRRSLCDFGKRGAASETPVVNSRFGDGGRPFP
jgi:hypothetical protein